MLIITTALVTCTAAPGFVNSNVPIYCSNDSECSSGEVCCGLHLYNEGHCAKSCVNSCKFYYNCPPWQFCRGPGKVGKCATSCVGKLYNFDYRCASRKSCCSDGKCATSCVGTSCDGK